jgi:hypothetical protein
MMDDPFDPELKRRAVLANRRAAAAWRELERNEVLFIAYLKTCPDARQQWREYRRCIRAYRDVPCTLE